MVGFSPWLEMLLIPSSCHLCKCLEVAGGNESGDNEEAFASAHSLEPFCSSLLRVHSPQHCFRCCWSEEVGALSLPLGNLRELKGSWNSELGLFEGIDIFFA